MENQIEIKEVFNDEITGWTRNITLTFNGKIAHIRLMYSDYDGYEVGTPRYEGEWTNDEKYDFIMYLEDWENETLATLDELTSKDN